MLTFLIDTSTERGLIALTEGTEVLFSEEIPLGPGTSKSLFPRIEAAFKTTKRSPKDLTRIAVGVGPGSYTGIRVGAAIAKSFAFALQCPLIGICSLALFVPQKDGTFASIVDARIGGFYLLKGEKRAGKITYTSEPIAVLQQELYAHLSDKDTLISPHVELIRNKIETDSKRWEWETAAPNGQQMALLAEEKWANGEVSRDGRLSLLYLRKTQAELEREQGKTEE